MGGRKANRSLPTSVSGSGWAEYGNRKEMEERERERENTEKIICKYNREEMKEKDTEKMSINGVGYAAAEDYLSQVSSIWGAVGGSGFFRGHTPLHTATPLSCEADMSRDLCEEHRPLQSAHGRSRA